MNAKPKSKLSAKSKLIVINALLLTIFCLVYLVLYLGTLSDANTMPAKVYILLFLSIAEWLICIQVMFTLLTASVYYISRIAKSVKKRTDIQRSLIQKFRSAEGGRHEE